MISIDLYLGITFHSGGGKMFRFLVAGYPVGGQDLESPRRALVWAPTNAQQIHHPTPFRNWVIDSCASL